MNRIEDIKRDLPGLRKHFGTDYGWPKDIEFLIRIAEASIEFIEAFEEYNKDTYSNCITGPQYHCWNLKKILEAGDE